MMRVSHILRSGVGLPGCVFKGDVEVCLMRACFADTREEDLTHPEDIAHFAKHDAMEDAADRQQELDRMPIVEQNIPQKFRRVP